MVSIINQTSSRNQATECIHDLYVFIKERTYHRSWPTNLCQNPTSPRTWPSPGCRSSSSLSLSAAAPAEPAAPSAASAGGPSAARPARPAPAASAMQESPAETHADGHAMRWQPATILPLCVAGPAWAGWAWCSSQSPTTEEPASSAAPGTASAGPVYDAKMTFTAGTNDSISTPCQVIRPDM